MKIYEDELFEIEQVGPGYCLATRLTDGAMLTIEDETLEELQAVIEADADKYSGAVADWLDYMNDLFLLAD